MIGEGQRFRLICPKYPGQEGFGTEMGFGTEEQGGGKMLLIKL